MKTISAKFIKCIVGPDDILTDGVPQVAFIGRSNVGKSSLINTLTNTKKLAVTSSFPGRTQQINVFFINESIYFMDLPGYGYARASGAGRQKIQELINWYFFDSGVEPRYVVLIIDAEVGPTKDDLEMLLDLRKANKNILVVANKIDKIKKSIYKKHIESVERKMNFKILPFSALKKIGVESLFDILTLD